MTERIEKRKKGRKIGQRLLINGRRLREVPSEELAREIAHGDPNAPAYWSELARRGINRGNITQQGFAIDPGEIGQQ